MSQSETKLPLKSIVITPAKQRFTEAGSIQVTGEPLGNGLYLQLFKHPVTAEQKFLLRFHYLVKGGQLRAGRPSIALNKSQWDTLTMAGEALLMEDGGQVE